MGVYTMKKALMYSMLLLLVVSPTFAASFSGLTYSLVDEKHLPLTRVNDPLTHENELITRYSYEHLSYLLDRNLGFQRRNDMRRVCDSMFVMFNRVPDKCHNLPQPVRVAPVPVRFVSPDVPVVQKVVRRASIPTQSKFVYTPYRFPAFSNYATSHSRQAIVHYTPKKVVESNPVVQQPATQVQVWHPVYRPWR